eukprot:scaffold5826_cov291-Prasinococcus_capsulatus_cf.AAC.6
MIIRGVLISCGSSHLRPPSALAWTAQRRERARVFVHILKPLVTTLLGEFKVLVRVRLRAVRSCVRTRRGDVGVLTATAAASAAAAAATAAAGLPTASGAAAGGLSTASSAKVGVPAVDRRAVRCPLRARAGALDLARGARRGAPLLRHGCAGVPKRPSRHQAPPAAAQQQPIGSARCGGSTLPLRYAAVSCGGRPLRALYRRAQWRAARASASAARVHKAR